jgi:hypothetical protein
MKKKKMFIITLIMLSVLFVPSVMATPSSMGSGCVLGPKVTKDLLGVLTAFRIAAPLLMIGFTIFEAIKSLTKGDGGAELKVVFNRLKKRFIYVVLLIFIPTLVSLGLNAMGLTSECDLQAIDERNAALNTKEKVCNQYGTLTDFDSWRSLTSQERVSNDADKAKCEAAGCNYYSGWCTVGNPDTCNPNTGVYDGCDTEIR